MVEHSYSHKMNCVSGLLTNNVVTKFSESKNHEERFTIILEAVVRSSDVLFDFKCRKKVSEHSVRLREGGNKSFMNSQYYKALQEYTESILYAVDSSEELALAYANRSAALFKLDKCEDCIRDIDRALNLKFPDRLKMKLYKRKGLCLRSLGRPGASYMFSQALLWVDQMTLNEDEKDDAKHELAIHILTPYPTLNLPEKAIEYPFEKILQANSIIPAASDAIAVKYSERYGRHIVATRKIEPGEVLVIEKPFCKRLTPQNVHTNCSYCLRAAWSMIPCTFCVNVAYCSEDCRDKAWEEYHEIECPILGPLLCLNVNDQTCLATRMAIIATKKGKKMDELRQEVTIADSKTDLAANGYCKDGKIHSDQYPSLHCSVPVHQERYSIQQLIPEAIHVAIAVCVLAKESLIFGKKLTLDTLTKNPDVTFIGGLMFKHTHLGAHIKTHKLGSYDDAGLPREIGHALMAVGSLFNHSCDPNTIRQWRVDLMTIFAAHPIQEGEQLFDNYGPDYTMMTKSQRATHFRRWKFDCECIACTQDWPLFHDLPSFKVQRMIPRNRRKIDKAVERFRKCETLVPSEMGQNGPHTLDELVNLIGTLFTYAKRPCKELTMAIQLLKLYHAIEDNVLDYEQTSQAVSDMQRQCFLTFFKEMLE